ncbi:Hypothetical protein FKW44_018245 [Caligus rogercresseyi]|uniref:Uncharacterized protein n=1 Tax=Caligus rogercresseyi TaxID=217165 RepID=A0A7T8JWN0_CALRO|nr:Hypothetical protein FKW44_018245 [Caligus rogercresseyi]
MGIGSVICEDVLTENDSETVPGIRQDLPSTSSGDIVEVIRLSMLLEEIFKMKSWLQHFCYALTWSLDDR